TGVAPILRMAAEQGGAAQSRIWVGEQRVPALSAAWANGLLAAALDFDCVHDATGAHLDIVIAPALLALAGRSPLSGREFLVSYIAGRELMARMALSMENNPGWYLSSAFGVI